MSRSSARQIRILHVDDDPSFTDLTGTFLEREDDRFVVETATNADEGLELIQDRPPDCVVSDYNMPGTNGLEFLEAVREERPDLPFVLFTGKGSEAVASDAISAGVTDYLQKRSGTEGYELLANRIRNAVHARREAERADRQEQLMRLTEFAGDTGGFELDVDSGNLLLTDGTRRLVGLPEDVHLSLEEAIELYHPDDRADVRRTVDRAAETGEETRGTWRLRTLDGDERLVDVTITPATENDDVTTLRGAVHDVTERRARQQELEQIETLFRNAQDSLFLIDVDDEFTVERVNPAYETATGLAADQLRGRTPREILGEQQGAAVARRYRDCIERREPLEYTEQLEFGASPTRWETRIAPVVLDGSVEYIVGATRDVTDREQRQQELRRLRQAIDGANVPITLADPSQENTPLVYVNDAFEDVTGYPAADALGRNCRFLQGEDTDPEKIAELRDAIDNEEPVSVELRNYRKDGTEFWNRLTLTPIYDDSGRLVRYLGTQEDVTERKERERELRAERRFVEQALDALDDLFYVLDTDGSFRRWNERAREVTGHTDRELADMHAIELFPEDEHETIAGAIETTLADGQATVEADLLTADGECLPYEFSGARLTDADGNVTGLVGIGRDLTERRQRERRFQALTEKSTDLISIVDADGTIRYQSPSIEHMLGYAPEETIGDAALAYVHPEDRADVADAFERGVADPDATPVVAYRARHADGSWRWLEARGNNQLDDPAVEGYIVNSRDVTDRNERKRELERTQDLMSDIEQLAGIGAWEYDPETETTVMTDETYRIHGLEPDADLPIADAFEYVHPDDREQLTDRFTDCLETGRPYEVDVRLITAEGARRWITARGKRVDGPGSGRVVRGYVRDITDEKTRERQLTELDEVSNALLTATTQQEVVDIGLRAATDVLDFRANAIHLSDADDTQLTPVARTDELTSLVGTVPTLPVADSIAGRAYRRGEPVVIEDVRRDPDVHDPETDLRGHVYLPLADHGVLIAGSEDLAAFDEQDLALGELLAGALVAALDRIDRERAARRQREQLSLFFDESPLGAVQWDDEFRFERLNGRAEEILGYSEAELRGDSWERIVAAADSERVGDAVEDLLDADGGRRVINRNVRKDGETVTCEWHNRAVTDDDGVVQSVFSKFQDVTDRERRKAELRTYETIIEALSDAVYVVDADGRFTYVNDEFAELVGYDRETILGRTPSLIKDEDAVERAQTALGRLLSSDGPDTTTFEVTVQPRDGDPVVCEDHMGVLPYDGDRFDGSVGTLRDITEQNAHERELAALNRQYRTLIENFPDGAVFLFDEDLEYVQAGGRELAAVGLSPEAVTGATPHDLFPADIADELAGHYRATLRGASHTFEQAYADERYRIRTAPVRTDDGEITHGMAVATNVTERTAQQRELERRNERLEAFASIVSHDLQGPLAVAEGHLELARETDGSDDLAEAAAAIDRSQDLIDDLLTIARGGKRATEVESVALADVATDSWRTTETGSATLDVDTTRRFEADRSRLTELLENLYANAVEHGGDDVTVSVGATDHGFYVADTGSGIPVSDREAAFEAGYSTDGNGTGFGLWIVERIADAHGWEVAVTESEQGGARFDVTGLERTEAAIHD
jgi:PAS domain S-box-containing protein